VVGSRRKHPGAFAPRLHAVPCHSSRARLLSPGVSMTLCNLARLLLSSSMCLLLTPRCGSGRKGIPSQSGRRCLDIGCRRLLCRPLQTFVNLMSARFRSLLRMLPDIKSVAHRVSFFSRISPCWERAKCILHFLSFFSPSFPSTSSVIPSPCGCQIPIGQPFVLRP